MNELLRKLLFLPPQRSTMAKELDILHYAVISTTMVGAFVVTLVAAYFVIRYRRRKDSTSGPHPFAGDRPKPILEVLFVSFLFVLFLSLWVVGARQYVTFRVAPEGAMHVYVTAKQWMWKFAYPEGKSTTGTLIVPVGRPVELVMTSRDVIHSFYVSDFRVKQDVLPGRYTTVWFEASEPGTFPILCTEFCGTDHSRMRGEVVALAPDEYAKWLRDAPSKAPETQRGPEMALEDTLVRRGELVAAQQGCLRCHTLDGLPHIGPTWAGLYGTTVALEGGESALVDEAYITESMMDPEARIHQGFPRVMPSFLGRIQPGETAAIIELIKSLRDVVPKEGARGPIVKEARGIEVKRPAPAGGERPLEPPGTIPLAPPGGFVPRENARPDR